MLLSVCRIAPPLGHRVLFGSVTSSENAVPATVVNFIWRQVIQVTTRWGIFNDHNWWSVDRSGLPGSDQSSLKLVLEPIGVAANVDGNRVAIVVS